MAHAGEWNQMIDDLRVEMLAAVGLAPGFGPVPWSRPTPPAGWIFADGAVLGAATPYTALRAAYIADGFPWGQDGNGNPKVPDMRGRTAAGVDSGAGRLTNGTLGTALGAEKHTLAATEMPAHNHGVNDPGHAHNASQDGHSHTLDGIAMDRSAAGYYLNTTSGGYSGRVALYPGSSSANTGTTSGASANAVYVAGAATGISTQNSGSGGAHNNVQPTLVVGYIVKT